MQYKLPNGRKNFNYLQKKYQSLFHTFFCIGNHAIISDRIDKIFSLIARDDPTDSKYISMVAIRLPGRVWQRLLDSVDKQTDARPI